jgi:hypothetical protein
LARFNKSQLTQAGLRRREISIPDTDGTIFIRELSTAQVREYAAKFKSLADKPESEDAQLDLTCDLVIAGVCDEHGKPMFGPEDIGLVKGMSLSTIAFIAAEISKLSGMSADLPTEKKS